jgi:hypothetical protein
MLHQPGHPNAQNLISSSSAEQRFLISLGVRENYYNKMEKFDWFNFKLISHLTPLDSNA